MDCWKQVCSSVMDWLSSSAHSDEDGLWNILSICGITLMMGHIKREVNRCKENWGTDRFLVCVSICQHGPYSLPRTQVRSGCGPRLCPLLLLPALLLLVGGHRPLRSDGAGPLQCYLCLYTSRGRSSWGLTYKLYSIDSLLSKRSVVI